MTPSTWPALLPFDPESGEFPPVMEALFARPAATVPAVLVVASSGARRGGWAASAAIAIASAWAERREGITLAELSADAPELAAALGLEPAEGLIDVFEFGVSLGRAARPVEAHGFRYLSPGLYVPDARALLGHRQWERLVTRHAEEQATLLAFVPADAPGLESLARRIGKALLLAGADEANWIAAGLPSECSVLAVLGPADEAAAGGAVGGAAEGAGAGVAGTVRRDADAGGAPPAVDPVAADPVSEEELLAEPTFVQRSPGKRRAVSPVLWVLLAAALGLGAWVGAQRFLGAGAAQDAPPSGPAASPPESAAAAAEPEPVEAPLPYAVAVEAHPDFATARDRVAALRRAEPQIPFYLAPIVVDSVVYYRVLAGLAADTAAAGALMRRLVDRGHKTEVDAWAIRPTVWAYRLGEFGSGEAAAARADSLLAQGVPTYVVEIPYTSGPPRYRLYAGAYEGPAQGVVMARLLEQAGVEAQLVRRMGRPAE